MKKLFILLLLTIGLFSCNHKHANWNKINLLADRHQDETSSEKLVLNNGDKWKVDSITNNNVKNLQAIVKGLNNGPERSLKTFTKAGDDLQTGLDKMILECKMQGPAHTALHKWLEPLVEKVAELKRASTPAEATPLFESVNLQVSRYDQYFEL